MTHYFVKNMEDLGEMTRSYKNPNETIYAHFSDEKKKIRLNPFCICKRLKFEKRMEEMLEYYGLDRNNIGRPIIPIRLEENERCNWDTSDEDNCRFEYMFELKNDDVSRLPGILAGLGLYDRLSPGTLLNFCFIGDNQWKGEQFDKKKCHTTRQMFDGSYNITFFEFIKYFDHMKPDFAASLMRQ